MAMTAKELQEKMLIHIESVREYQSSPDRAAPIHPDGQEANLMDTVMFKPSAVRSVLRHLDGADLLRVEQFIRSFGTE